MASYGSCTEKLIGECDDLLCRALSRAALVGRPRIVIDMSDVSMIDAGGLGALVTVYCASAGKLIALSLVRVPARVRQLLTVTHLTMFLTVFDSAEEGVRMWQRRRRLPGCTRRRR